MAAFRIGLLGHGTVGGAFAELLAERADALERLLAEEEEIERRTREEHHEAPHFRKESD